MRSTYFFLLGCVALMLPATAQETITVTTSRHATVTLGGTLQARASYGHHEATDGTTRDRLGFGIRRGRFRTRARIGERLGLYIQLELTGTVSPTDLQATYRLNDRWTVRAGYLVSAQPRALNLTSHTRIDAVDRATIAERWAGNTIGSTGRDFGVDLRYQGGDLSGFLFVGNGDGNWDRMRGNFREGISSSDVTRNTDRTGLNVAGYGNLKLDSGLEVGGFASYNTSRNPNTASDFGGSGRRYFSYAAHAYWGANPGSQPVRLKADVIGIASEESDVVTVLPLDPQHWLGVSLLGATRVHEAAEAFVRYEHVINDLNLDDSSEMFITGGASLSLSALQGLPYHLGRLTLAYSAALPAGDAAVPTQHLVILQAQVVF